MAWNPGDLAVCIDDSPCKCVNCLKHGYKTPWPIAKRTVCRVESVSPEYALKLVGIPGPLNHTEYFADHRFEKIVKATDSFINLIRRKADA